MAFGITSLGAEGSAAATETETPVRTGSVTQTVSATGNAIAAEDLTLNFQGTGVLTEVDVTAGSTVTAGQVLARIDSTTAENQLKTAQANLASAQARMQGLLHPLTAQDLVKNQAAVDQAQAAVDTAQTALDNAKANLAQDTITQQNAIDRAKQALANAQAVSSTGMAGQQSALDQARQTLTDAASHLPVGVIVTDNRRHHRGRRLDHARPDVQVGSAALRCGEQLVDLCAARWAHLCRHPGSAQQRHRGADGRAPRW